MIEFGIVYAIGMLIALWAAWPERYRAGWVQIGSVVVFWWIVVLMVIVEVAEEARRGRLRRALGGKDKS